MKSDTELENFLNELPHLTSKHNRQMLGCSFNVGSSSYTSGLCFSDDESSSPTPFDDFKCRTGNTQHIDRLSTDSKEPDFWYMKNNNDRVLDDQGLAREFQNLKIGDRNDVSPSANQFRIPDGFRSLHSNVARVEPINGENYRFFDGLTSEFSINGGFPQSPLYGFGKGFDEEMKFVMGQRGYKVGDSMESYLAQNRSNTPLFSGPSFHNFVMNYPFKETSHRENDRYGSGLPVQNPCLLAPYGDEYNTLKHYKMDLIADRGVLSSQMIHPKQGFSVENVPLNPPPLKVRMSALENRGVPQSVQMMKSPRKLNAYGCEDTFIIHENSLNGAISKYDISRGWLKNFSGGSIMPNLREARLELNGRLHPGRICKNGRSLSSYQTNLHPTCDSLVEVRDSIYFMAKDQHGCRFLQQRFDDDGGSIEDRQIIFDEIIDHIAELMVNPFGNYLIQKLLHVCDDNQRMSIVQMVTKEPGELVKISLNTHGTRVVQKLIETLKTRKQILLVVLALEPGFLDLIKDLNGNHVIQRCLQCFNSEDNEFIFYAAAKFCVDIATHQHGCCVLQRCIDHSIGEHRQKLIAEISANGLFLAQDPFGNYVVQYIIELKIASASAMLISQFEGHFVHLSMQKFSSHVVEKCLKFCKESQPRIVHELLSMPHFELLLQDPYANYVIQSALESTKGALHDLLVAAVRPHTILRTNPHCKKIFSRGLLKK